jgi:hypothetical protein
MIKLLGNASRHINIVVVNKLARLCLNIDLWKLLRTASIRPFRFHSFRRGPGANGHCISIDPTYLSHNLRAKLGYPFRCVELGEENQQHPAGRPGRPRPGSAEQKQRGGSRLANAYLLLPERQEVWPGRAHPWCRD